MPTRQSAPEYEHINMPMSNLLHWGRQRFATSRWALHPEEDVLYLRSIPLPDQNVKDQHGGLEANRLGLFAVSSWTFAYMVLVFLSPTHECVGTLTLEKFAIFLAVAAPRSCCRTVVDLWSDRLGQVLQYGLPKVLNRGSVCAAARWIQLDAGIDIGRSTQLPRQQLTRDRTPHQAESGASRIR